MPESTLARIREIVSTLFSVPMEQVTAESSPDTIENWDSMGALSLTLELEQEFNIQIMPEDADRMWNVGAIAEAVDQYTAASA